MNWVLGSVLIDRGAQRSEASAGMGVVNFFSCILSFVEQTGSAVKIRLYIGSAYNVCKAKINKTSRNQRLRGYTQTYTDDLKNL